MDEATNDVATRDDIFGEIAVEHKWVTVREWRNRRVCVWAPTFAERQAIIELGRKPSGELFQEGLVLGRIIILVRDGDTPEAKAIFSLADGEALKKQPDSVIQLLDNTIGELETANDPLGGRFEAIRAFLADRQKETDCLGRVAQHCAACTECPQSADCQIRTGATSSP